eukprot:superscaffoldBa00000188_g2535
MQRLGVIEPSQSEWCNPVVIVVKKDGSLRICIDFRKLNAMSEFDAYPTHLCHLERVLGQIQQAGLTLNPAKCQWAKEEAKYLGYRLGRGEVRPQVDKVEAICGCPRPRTKKEVRSFLGLAGWYRKFVPQFATIAAPLTALTAKDQRNLVAWNEDCETAFQTLKACLCSSPVLRSPDFSQRFLVQTDASAVGLGAVLAQEGLAIKWALESLRYYLLGREFDLETDHRALTWMNSMKDHNSRLTRWYLSLQPFQFQIRHRAGKTNVVADYLSRLPHIANLGEEGDNAFEGAHSALTRHTHIHTYLLPLPLVASGHGPN